MSPSCGLSVDKFRRFVEHHPDFAEDFLYTENTGLHSGTRHHHQSNLSSSNLEGTASTKMVNGICPDFSPNDHDATVGLLKKHK